MTPGPIADPENPLTERSPATISVVVPMFNEADRILGCLQSLNAQVRVPDEVVVVDNNSTDGSIDVVKNGLARLSRLRIVLVSESKPGPAAARNRGIRESIGHIVAFTDADCTVAPEWCLEILSAFEADPELGAVGGVELGSLEPRSVMETVVSACWLPRADRQVATEIHDKYDWLSGVFISTFNCAFRQRDLSSIGGFDASFYPAGEDMDLWMRALGNGTKIRAWHGGIAVVHRQALTFGKLLKKMFGYGMAVPHVTRAHFAGRVSLQWPRSGSCSWRVRGLTVLLWHRTLVVAIAVSIAAVAISITPSLGMALGFLVLGYVPIKVRAIVARKGYRLGFLATLLASAVWSARIMARQAGMIVGSIRYRVVCL